MRKKITLLALIAAFYSFQVKAQTTLAAGDIAFTGYISNTTNNVSAEDRFSFILLKTVVANTVINFTDNGWLLGTTNAFRAGETTIIWTAPVGGLTAGTEVYIAQLTASAGTVTGTELSLNGPNGDQVLAYQGTAASPTFISAIHTNFYLTSNGDAVNSTEAAWDGDANTSQASGLPPGLTSGVNAIWLSGDRSPSTELTNGKFNCASADISTIANTRTALNNRTNWTRNNTIGPGFTLPTACSYVVTSSTTWNGSTWSNGTPTSSLNAVIASSTTPGSFTCKALTINSGIALTIGFGVTATVNGNITNSGNGISGAGTLAVASNAAISGNNIGLSGVLTVGSGATLTTNNLLTLKSTSITSTGQVGVVSGSISGDVKIERYIPASNRAYRLLSPGVTTSTSIKANWQEGVNVPSSSSYPNAGGTTYNPNAGYGTHITGNSSGAFGFDATVNGSPSLYTFNNSTQAWVAVSATNSTLLDVAVPYRIFIRGDRSSDLRSNTPTVTATTLRTTGTLSTGAINYTGYLSSANGAYSLVANPYWAAVDWTALRGAGTTNIGTTYWIWNPTIAGTNGKGGYTSFTRTGAGTGTVSGVGSMNKNIQPGQAFFILNTAASPTLTFQESYKDVAISLTNTQRTQGNGTGVDGTITVKLFLPQHVANDLVADAATIAFRKDFAKAEDDYDAPKFANPEESISFKVGSKYFGMNALPIPTSTDTVQLNMGTMLSKEYVLQIEGAGFTSMGDVDAYLIDQYKNEKTPINLLGTINIDYKIDGNSASANAGRFLIVLEKKAALPWLQLNENLQVTLTPNPATNYVQVNYSAKEKGNTAIRIINANGQIMLATQLGNQQIGQHTMPISKLAKGIYTVELTIGEGRTTTKLVKQ